MMKIPATVCVSCLIALILVHYLEECLLPVVEYVRLKAYGNQSYTSAISGCDSLPPQGTWVHPTALALTVYGDAQSLLVARYGPHEPEVLPDYAEATRGNSELLCVADYLLASNRSEKIGDKRVRVFRFEIPHDKYSLESGWVSGLAQGIVGQIFLGAHMVDGQDKYLQAAKEAGRLLDVAKQSGGVRVDLQGGGIWFVEYAQSGVSPPMVLNGHLLAMDFLYWITQVDDDELWSRLFDRGLQATVSSIGQHQGFGWSFYDQQHNLATRKYQSFHVRQLSRYSQHDDTEILDSARQQMQRQLFVPIGIFRRLLTQPSRLLVFQAGLVICVVFPVVWILSGLYARGIGRRRIGQVSNERDA